MEEQYKKVTEIINELAAANPYITSDKIAKAKSMYNGDMRDISIIRAELEAYSAEIAQRAQEAKKTVEPPTKDEGKAKEPAPTHAPSFEIPEEPKEEIDLAMPTPERKEELQSMIDGAFPANAEPDHTEEHNFVPEKPKQYVKTSEQPEAHSAPAEAGYGNVGALLTLTIMFSIVTIIMAIATILSR